MPDRDVKPSKVVEHEKERMERLISAIEAQTNATMRLLQELAAKRVRKTETPSQRARRLALDKPITVTPLAQAAAQRALARVRSG